MAGAVDIELNGVPVRTATPLPVSIASGTAVVQDVNAKNWGGTAVTAPLGNNAAKNSNFTRASIGPVVNARTQVSDQCVTGTAAAGTGVTATLPAPGANLRQYITRIQIIRFAAAALTAAATPVLVTTTNIPATPTFSIDASAAAQGTTDKTDLDFTSAPIESSADNTNTTIVCPATTNVIWRVNVWYYNA